MISIKIVVVHFPIRITDIHMGMQNDYQKPQDHRKSSDSIAFMQMRCYPCDFTNDPQGPYGLFILACANGYQKARSIFRFNY